MTARESGYALGVELGGSYISLTLGSGIDDLVVQRQFPIASPAEALPPLEAEVREVAGRYGFHTLGIATFGPLDLDPRSATYGAIVNSSKSDWSGTNLLQWAQRFDCPIVLDTDANAPALAEGLWGAAQGLRNWAHVVVDAGIGVGLVIDGRPLTGNMHPEAGHLLVPNPGGFAGHCPYHKACVEGLASSRAIQAQTGADVADLSFDHPIWDEVSLALSALCHNLMMTVCPERILMGGRVMETQPHLLQRVRDQLPRIERGFGVTDSAINRADFIAVPALGDRAGPLGALAIAL